eukprot:3358817-Karenia_brevis.AAC.1
MANIFGRRHLTKYLLQHNIGFGNASNVPERHGLVIQKSLFLPITAEGSTEIIALHLALHQNYIIEVHVELFHCVVGVLLLWRGNGVCKAKHGHDRV